MMNPLALTALGAILSVLLAEFLSFMDDRKLLRVAWIVWLASGTYLMTLTFAENRTKPETTESIEAEPAAEPRIQYELVDRGEFDGLMVSQRVLPTLDSRTDQIEFEVFEGEERIASGIAINVDNECSWSWASSEQLVDRKGGACSLAERLKSPVISDRLSRSFNIVFVGMDSYPGRTNRNSQKLTSERAYRLAQFMINALPQLSEGTKRGWVAGIGRSTVKVRKNHDAELRQRAATILGVTTEKDWPFTQRIIRAVLNTVEVGGTDFSSYDLVREVTPSVIDLAVPSQK